MTATCSGGELAGNLDRTPKSIQDTLHCSLCPRQYLEIRPMVETNSKVIATSTGSCPMVGTLDTNIGHEHWTRTLDFLRDALFRCVKCLLLEYAIFVDIQSNLGLRRSSQCAPIDSPSQDGQLSKDYTLCNVACAEPQRGGRRTLATNIRCESYKLEE